MPPCGSGLRANPYPGNESGSVDHLKDGLVQEGRLCLLADSGVPFPDRTGNDSLYGWGGLRLATLRIERGFDLSNLASMFVVSHYRQSRPARSRI